MPNNGLDKREDINGAIIIDIADWNKSDIVKLAICWALTLTTSTLLTVKC